MEKKSYNIEKPSFAKYAIIMGIVVVLCVAAIFMIRSKDGKDEQNAEALEMLQGEETTDSGNDDVAESDTAGGQYLLAREELWESFDGVERVSNGYTLYNEKGYMSEVLRLYGDGEYQTTYEYEYDEYGYPVVCNKYVEDYTYGEEYTETYEYNNEYDENGTIIRRTYSMMEEEYTEEFDENGNLETATIYSPGEDALYTYYYDSTGKIEYIVLPDGTEEHYYFGVPGSGDIQVEYDDNDRVSMVERTADGYTEVYYFDEHENIIEQIVYYDGELYYGYVYEYQWVEQ